MKRFLLLIILPISLLHAGLQMTNNTCVYEVEVFNISTNLVWLGTINPLATTLTLPAQVDNLPIQRMAPGCLFNHTNLIAIDLSATSITNLAPAAFSGCHALQSANLPTALSAISSYAFYDCASLTNVLFNSTSLLSIGAHAFSHCTALMQITLPSSLSQLGASAFANCRTLKTLSLPSNILVLPDFACHDCSTLTNLTQTDQLLSIGAYALSGTALRTFTLPSTLTNLGIGAFCKCTNLQTFANVTFFPDSCIYGCTALTNLDLSASATLGQAGCAYSGVQSIALNASIPLMPEAFLAETPIEAFYVTGDASSVTVGDDILLGCSKTTVVYVSTNNATWDNIDYWCTLPVCKASLQPLVVWCQASVLPQPSVYTTAALTTWLGTSASDNLENWVHYACASALNAEITTLGTTPPLLTIQETDGTMYVSILSQDASTTHVLTVELVACDDLMANDWALPLTQLTPTTTRRIFTLSDTSYPTAFFKAKVLLR